MEQEGPHEAAHESGPSAEAEAHSFKGSSELPDSAPATPDTVPLKQKKRDSEFYRAIGKKGGDKLKETRGSDYFQDIAHKGGKENARRQGLGHFAEMGKKGGQVTKERRGSEFYSDIGKKGATKRLEKKREREERARQEKDIP